MVVWIVYNGIMILTIIILLLLTSAGLGYAHFKMRIARNALQQKLSVVESAVALVASRLDKVEEIQKEELSQEQIDYRDKLQLQYAVLFQQVQDRMAAELKTVKAEANDLVKKSRSEATDLVKKSRVEFEAKLKEEFDKACEKIKFDEIEYKKTITKKRKEYSRKNGKNAKPQRIWRYIDEE